jgi:hypothetical protein
MRHKAGESETVLLRSKDCFPNWKWSADKRRMQNAENKGCEFKVRQERNVQDRNERGWGE